MRVGIVGDNECILPVGDTMSGDEDYHHVLFCCTPLQEVLKPVAKGSSGSGLIGQQQNVLMRYADAWTLKEAGEGVCIRMCELQIQFRLRVF